MPRSIITSALMVMTCLLLCSFINCYDDSFYESIQQEADTDSLYAHLTCFDLPDTGQTLSYTDTWGEDSDYSTLPSQSYTDNTDGTVTDNVTGFTWTKCSMGEDSAMDNTSDCSAVHGKYTNSAAVLACSNLDYAGHADWRLPTVPELLTLVNYGKPAISDVNQAAIDETFFPNTEFADNRVSGVQDLFTSLSSTEQYWTRTSHYYEVFGQPLYIAINFDDGMTKITFESDSFYVRCVRGQ